MQESSGDVVHLLGRSPKDVLNDIFRVDKNPSGKQYFGTVVNNNDPLKIGRVRVRVFNIFDDSIKDSDLPWAIPEISFMGSKVGNFIVPTIGTLVYVRFDNGEVSSPIYTSKVLDRNNISSNKNDDYPDSMILWETDDGEFFRINRKTRETFYRHSSGATLKIDTLGNINLDTNGTINVNAPIIQFPTGSVVPTGSGPFCSMNIDPLTGMPQTGNVEFRS